MEGNKGGGIFTPTGNSNTPDHSSNLNNSTPETNSGVNSGSAPTSISTPMSAPTPDSSAPETPHTPGSLFSDPEPIIESPEHHPFFAHHPTRTFAAGTGDIVLGSGEATSAKKPVSKKILIAVAALVLILIAVVTLIFVLSRPSATPSSRTEFREYAGLLVTGVKNPSFTLSNHDISSGYYAQHLFESNPDVDKHAYFQNLQTAFGTFVSAAGINLDVARNNSASALAQSAASTRDILDYFVAYTSASDPTTSELINYNKANGYQSTVEYIAQQFTPFTSNESPDIQLFGQKKVEQYRAMLDYINFYHPCITDGTIDESCVQSTPISQDIQESLERANEFSSLDLRNRNDLLQVLLNNSYELNQELSK